MAFHDYSSIDKKPCHKKCEKGEDLWCSYQRARAAKKEDFYVHDYKSLASDVLKAIKPIYEDHSKLIFCYDKIIVT